MKHLVRIGAVALVLTAGLARIACAQQNEAAAIKSGIDQLHALPASVARARSVLGTFNFGPFHISGSCGFNCWGKLCWQDWNWSWNFPQFGNFKTALDQRLAAVAGQANNFDPAFAPTRQWLTGTLPQFSHNFDSAAQTLQSDTNVIATSGDAAAVAREKQNIIDTLSQISGQLTSGYSGLVRGTSALAQFNASFGATLNQVGALSSALDGAINSSRDDMSRRMGSWPCGQGDAINGYNGVANSVRVQFGSAVNVASATAGTAQESDKAVSLILGTINNLQTRCQGALSQIKAAQSTPQGAVQNLRVNVAAAEWRDLAQYAVTQFGK